MTLRYVHINRNHVNGCALCGSMRLSGVETVCAATTCAACGARQLHAARYAEWERQVATARA